MYGNMHKEVVSWWVGGNVGEEAGKWVGVAFTVQCHMWYKVKGGVLSAIDRIFGTGISVEKRLKPLFNFRWSICRMYNNDIIVKKCNQTVPLFDHIQDVDYIGLFEHYTVGDTGARCKMDMGMQNVGTWG